MIGVILAAGMAKRLRPLTDTKPKCLLKVGNRTLLERTVRAMQQAGITEFVVVTGYRGDQIRSFLENLEPLDNLEKPTFHFLHNADYEHNNNIYSLWMAGEVVRGKDFLLMDSDILCDPAAVVCIAQMQEPTCNPADAIGESVGIEKMTAAYSEAIYKELDQMITKEGLIDIFYERAFERLIPQGYTFKVVDTTDYFSYELDTPEDFQRAQELIPEALL